MALKKFSTQVKDFGGTICPTYSDPLDPRVIVEFETDLWEHAGDTFGVIHEEYCKVYEGIKVYVEETNSTYEYVGPIEPDFGIKISDANHRGNWRAVSTPGTDANVVVTTLVADDGSEVTPEANIHKNKDNKDELVSTDKNKLYILSRDSHTKKEDSRYDYDHDGWIETTTEDSVDGKTHNALIIRHSDVQRTDTEDAIQKEIDVELKFPFVDEIETDEKGHIIGVNTKTVSWDPEKNYAYKYIKVDDTHPGNRTDATPEVKTYNGTNPIEASVPEAIVPTSTVSTSLVAESETDTLTFTDDRWIHVGAIADSDTISILHESVDRKDEKVIQNKSVDEKVTFNIVDEVISDVKGHVTGIRTNTFTWNPEHNYAFKTIKAVTSNVLDRTDAHQDATSKNMLEAVNTTSDSTTTLVADSEIDTLTFKDDKYISIVADDSSNTLTFSHESVQRFDGDTTQTKETDKDLSVQIVDLVITDAKGHVTGVRTNTLSIPRDTNFGYKKFEVAGNSVVTNTNKDYVNTGSSIADHEDDIMKIQGDTWMNVTIADDQINLSHGVSSDRYNITSNNKNTDDTYEYKSDEKPKIYTSEESNPADTYDTKNNNVITSIVTDDANHLISTTYRTDIPTKVWVQWEIENAMKSTDAMVFKGGFDPADALPTSNDGSILSGYTYKITDNGTITLGDEVRTVVIGDTLISTADNPTSADWMILETRNDRATKSVPGNVIIGDGIDVDTSGKISLDVINYGSGINPVYINDNKQVVASTETVGSTTKPIYLNNGTITESNATVGSSIKPMYLQDGTLTASTETIGSSIKPMYLNEGTLTESSETVGSGIIPTFLSSGTITQSSSNVGTSKKPMYMANGTLTECTYELNAKVNSGTKDTLAYYSGTDEVSSFTDKVGSGTKQWYLNNGVPTESTSNVGSSVIPMYLNNGDLTASNASVGKNTENEGTPVYMNAGTLTAVTNINSGLLSNLGDGVKVVDGKLTFDLPKTTVVETISGSNGVTANKTGNTYSVFITDGGVTTAKIADTNVTTAKLADSAVTTAKIYDANVTEAKLATSAVTTAKIKDANVTTAKIADGAITAGKLASGVVNNPTITLKNGTTNLGSFTLNQASAGSIDLASLIGEDTKNTAGATNNANTKLFLIGAASQGANPQTYSNASVYVGTDNCMYAPTYYATSDMRYKTVLNDLKLNVELIANLPTFDFEWKDGSGKSTGTSAQAVKEILPNLVSGEDKLTLNYSALGAVEGIILARKIVELENRIVELENKLK